MKAPLAIEAAIYQHAAAAMRRLPPTTVLGGDWRGEFRVADSLARVLQVQQQLGFSS